MSNLATSNPMTSLVSENARLENFRQVEIRQPQDIMRVILTNE